MKKVFPSQNASEPGDTYIKNKVTYMLRKGVQGADKKGE